MSEQNKEITSQSTFAEFLYILGDVAAGKISLKEACKHLTDKDKDRAKRLFETTKQAFSIIKSSIKERKQELDMQAQHDMSSAVKINHNGKTSYMGVKPKKKKSWFKQMSENLGRTLKTTGSVLTGEKTIKQATKEEFQAVRDSLSGSSNVFRGVRATAETISSFAKNVEELRGIKTPKTELSKKEANPYDRLENEQFSVAMHTAYHNLVRMENFGNLLPDAEKDKAIAEINRLMESAQKRFPDAKTSDKGSYFKDTKIQNVEAQLFAFMKEDCTKNSNNNLVKEEMQKYDSWRQGKDYAIKMPTMEITESPFNNIELYGGVTTKGIESLHGKFTAKDHLYNPLQKGRNVMTEAQMIRAKAQLGNLNLR